MSCVVENTQFMKFGSKSRLPTFTSISLARVSDFINEQSCKILPAISMEILMKVRV